MIPKEVLKKVQQIEIRTTGIVNSVLSGAYSSSFKGQGMEFAEVREYVPGDEIRSIDWNVTARHGTPYIKKFIEERELTVILVVDASSSGEFGSQSEMKGEVMATISALLAFSATSNNDRVGLLIFTSQVEMFIPPKKGRKHVLRVIRELLYFKPKEKGTNLSLALEYLNKILTRKAVVFVVSDFATGDFEKPIKLLPAPARGRGHHRLGSARTRNPRRGLHRTGRRRDRGNHPGGHQRRGFPQDLQEGSARRKAPCSSGMFRKLQIDFVEIVIQPKYDDTIHPLLEFFRKRAAKTPMKPDCKMQSAKVQSAKIGMKNPSPGEAFCVMSLCLLHFALPSSCRMHRLQFRRHAFTREQYRAAATALLRAPALPRSHRHLPGIPALLRHRPGGRAQRAVPDGRHPAGKPDGPQGRPWPSTPWSRRCIRRRPSRTSWASAWWPAWKAWAAAWTPPRPGRASPI